MSESVVFGQKAITIDEICDIALQRRRVELSTEPRFVETIQNSRKFLEALLERDGQIYGVTTGFGDSCTTKVTDEFVEDLSNQLVRFHRCGLGEYLSHEQGRAVMATRLASLVQGKSGVRLELLQKLVEFLNADIVPRIPSEGSVGASGDLTPMSYVAAALMGEGEVTVAGQVKPIVVALRDAEIEPLSLRAKEGLAIMNGTAVMTALASLAYRRAAYLTRLSSRITSLMCVALKGNGFHFDEALFAAKPYPGQAKIAGYVRSDLAQEVAPSNPHRLQDRYSLRCAPHVIGVLEDNLEHFRRLMEIELNSTNDNPVVDLAHERILHGGHFYGGHIAFVMDSMKSLIANIADLLDRQMALLVDPKFNNGLPANLVGVMDSSRAMSHGFKGVQIGVSAWTAEALKLTMPASVFSRSTECHNQDKVSMGTIAARDCLRVLQLTEQVAAAALLAVTQAIDLRRRQSELEPLSPAHQSFLNDIQSRFAFVDRDRPLDSTLREFVQQIQSEQWALYV